MDLESIVFSERCWIFVKVDKFDFNWSVALTCKIKIKRRFIFLSQMKPRFIFLNQMKPRFNFNPDRATLLPNCLLKCSKIRFSSFPITTNLKSTAKSHASSQISNSHVNRLINDFVTHFKLRRNYALFHHIMHCIHCVIRWQSNHCCMFFP
jgi:hypothetical protein